MDSKLSVQLLGTSELCFDKDSFMRLDFNVDEFMREYQCSSDGNLDILRDHLGVYLKILRSAMIDLINRDYADFVNLSTNLTGLDSLIQHLATPLGQLREEVLSVSQLLQSASSSVLADQQRQRIISVYKRKLATLTSIAARLDNLEDVLEKTGFHRSGNGVLAKKLEEEEEEEVEAELLERLAAEVPQLRHLMHVCAGAALTEVHTPRLEKIQRTVEECIEKRLKCYLECAVKNNQGDVSLNNNKNKNNKNNTALRRTLTACAILDTCAVAEEALRGLIRPTARDTLSETSIRACPRGLSGQLNIFLTSLLPVMQPLLALTCPHDNPLFSQNNIYVPGFRFVELCVFPEAVSALQSIPHLYSAAIPASFHERYLVCIEFIERLETMIGTKERIDAFRALPLYRDFMDKWDLSVYFQIKNQEIGQVVESSLCEENGLKVYLPSNGASGSNQTSTNVDGTLINTAPIVTSTLSFSSETTVSSKVDTNISDVTTDARSAILGNICNNDNKTCMVGSSRGVLRGVDQCWDASVFLLPLLPRFWKLTLLILSRHRTWLQSTLDKITQGNRGTTTSLPRSSIGHKQASSTELSLYLLHDLNVMEQELSSLYPRCIETYTTHLPSHYGIMLRNTLLSEINKWAPFRQQLLTLLQSELSEAMTTALAPVTDTPRLYRRTNRSPPIQAQHYVTAAVAPLVRLRAAATTANLSSTILQPCLTSICASVATSYYSLTEEVLGNVSKTEESLQSGLTDEDKIREQLHLDVEHFGAKLRELGVELEEVGEYAKLTNMVREARTIGRSAENK